MDRTCDNGILATFWLVVAKLGLLEGLNRSLLMVAPPIGGRTYSGDRGKHAEVSGGEAEPSWDGKRTQPRAPKRGAGRPAGVHGSGAGDGGELPEAGRC